MGVLVDNYPGAVKAIMATYYQELTGNREKN
ncbi:phage tail assembly chaperone [Klebsiella michiganensis]